MKNTFQYTAFRAALCLLVVSLPAAPTSSANLDVTTTADGNDGACDDHCTLREALIAANADPDRDIIDLPPGTYRLSIPGRDEDLGATGDLDILETVEIRGASERTTVVDGAGLDRVFHVHAFDSLEDDDPVEIFDLTIVGGAIGSPNAGGGILNHGPLVMKRCSVDGNSTSGHDAGGGGIANSGALVLEIVTVTHNSTDGARGDGGGIWNRNGALTLSDSRVAGNSAAGRGGGIWNEQGSTVITRTTVSGNTTAGVDASGGGVWAYASTMVIVTSRTFNRSAAGMFGQYLAGTTAEEGLRTGESGTVPHLTQSSAYRCNLGIANLGTTIATVDVILFDGDGFEVGSLSVSLDPGQLHQFNRVYRAVAGRHDVDRGYATIRVTSGSGVVGYGSVIDNGTGDAAAIPMWR